MTPDRQVIKSPSHGRTCQSEWCEFDCVIPSFVGAVSAKSIDRSIDLTLVRGSAALAIASPKRRTKKSSAPSIRDLGRAICWHDRRARQLSLRPSVCRQRISTEGRTGQASKDRSGYLFLGRISSDRICEPRRSLGALLPPAPRDPIEPSVSYRRQAFAKNEPDRPFARIPLDASRFAENLVDVSASPTDP